MRASAGFCLLLQVAVLAAEPLQVQVDGPRFVGSIGCKSSSCHGGAGEKRSQFITWSQKDFHTRAYAILTNARSERIAQALGISAAHESSRCTSCHAPMLAVAPQRLMKGAEPREGVSCEACHGAAEPWLRGHTRKDWSYATRVGAGMRDLKSFYVRANTCVACHQNLHSDVTAAGHPELFFELNSQSENEPKHWRDPAGSGVRAWLVGQAVALRELSWKVAENPNADTPTQLQWNAIAWLLNKVTSAEGTLVRIEAGGSPAGMQEQADSLARKAAEQHFSRDFADRIARTLVASDVEFRTDGALSKGLLFRRARRVVLALDSLAREPQRLRGLHEQVRSEAEFDPAAFARELATLQNDL
jgi:hypothetical protein